MTDYEPSPRLLGEPPNRCWFRIGVWGSGLCEDLVRFIHCFNCPVYQNAGKDFFDRPPPAEYTKRMSEALREPFEMPRVTPGSFLVFSLKNKRFALSSQIVRAVTPFCEIHTVPFRSNQLFLGLCPVRGKLRLCYSLVEALGGQAEPIHKDDFRRMILIGKPQTSFVFPVSEVEGLAVIPEDAITGGTRSVGGTIILGTASLGDQEICVLNKDYILTFFSNKQL